MNRLADLPKGTLDDDQRAVWAAVCAARGTETVNEGGGLVGPFNAFIHAPRLGRPALELLHALSYGTSLPLRTTELVILVVAARWQAEFEWWAHAIRARDNGVPDAVIAAIADRRQPPFADDVDRAVYAAARELVDTGRLADDTYRRAHPHLADKGMVELVTLVGTYTMVSFILNGFDVSLPAGERNRWTPPSGGQGATP
jgi:4-carboxymuconolactone decarboxylase